MCGNGIGKTLGFPTANLSIKDTNKLIPGIGVYAVWTYVKGIRYLGMLNIGKKPTFKSDNSITIELHILDFNQSIYSEELKLVILHKIRNEKKFQSKEKLISQLEKDEIRVKNYFNNLSPNWYKTKNNCKY